jgi:hypothetical protein
MNANKVGVLTFHRCFNYGSYWQARCLVEAIQSLGHDAELLDHDCDWVNRAEGRCLMQPTLPIRSPRADMPSYKRKGRKFLAAADALPLSPRFSLHAPDAAPRYRSIVVGSDEVWNFQHPWYGSKPIFFGSGLGADRLVSYAASFGNHDAASGIDPYWSDMLGRFDSLSVRDANSRALVQGALGAEPELVVDPVLLYPQAIRTNGHTEPAPYALVYGHGFPEWLATAVTRWSRRRGRRLLSVGYRNDWADEQRLDAGPDEFAALMAGADAVVTNFFHGCVFALVNGKPWVSTPTAYRFNKIRDLAAALDAGDHIVREDVTDARLDELLSAPLSATIGDRMTVLRERSRAFLAAALA